MGLWNQRRSGTSFLKKLLVVRIRQVDFAAGAYNGITKKATEDLMEFFKWGSEWSSLCDGAHHLDTALWVLLRLLISQVEATRMRYVFMGTKSNYYAPKTVNSI